MDVLYIYRISLNIFKFVCLDSEFDSVTRIEEYH